MSASFQPKLFAVLKEGYSREQFGKDVLAGVIVGIVALPLAIAFAIASGVPPEKGLITAVVAGFIISAFGGSRVQIGGPTGAFIVIVYGIVEQYGLPGLTISTLIAGFMIMLMGLARIGSVIKFIPHSLIVGFTSGIAVIIFSSQVKDFFGLDIETLPSHFLEKWDSIFLHLESVNLYAALIAISTVFITLYFHKIVPRIPGSLVAIIFSTIIVASFDLPVETIASRFGAIPSGLPRPDFTIPDWDTIRHLVQPAFTIALLGSIESLLSAVVADGMTGGNHRSNVELVAQGGANIFSAFFGGIPATGAIARTVTNIKNGGRTPVAGIVHALVLLLIMLFAGKWAQMIPLASLAGILVVVAYNMSEWKSFRSVLRGPSSDRVVLLTTFLLTVLVDLTVAIEIGMVLAAFLFMRRMAQISHVKAITDQLQEADEETEPALRASVLPKGVEVFEVNGPLFFGSAHNFKEAMLAMHGKRPEVLILRMRKVPIIDVTGLHNLKEFIKSMQAGKTKVILSGVVPGVLEELLKADFNKIIGEQNICADFEDALKRAQ